MTMDGGVMILHIISLDVTFTPRPLKVGTNVADKRRSLARGLRPRSYKNIPVTGLVDI
jgi:hypothetical protein